MKSTFLQFLSLAACIAAVSPALSAQGAVMKVRRSQDPAAQPPVAKQLAEVIEMLDADGLSAEQQQKAQAVLKSVVDRLQHDQKVVTFDRIGRGEGIDVMGKTARIEVMGEPGVEVFEVAEPEVAVIELDDDGVDVAAPKAKVRTRVLHVDGDGRVVARGGLGGAWVPKPPKAPGAERAPKAPRGEAFMLRSDGGGTWRQIEEDVEKAKADALRAAEKALKSSELDEEARAKVRMRISRNGSEAGRRRAVALDVTTDGDAPAAIQERAKADRLNALVQRARAPRAAQRGMVLELQDVTDEVRGKGSAAAADADDAELRQMIDEMRAEMKEVRALMERIREQSSAADSR